MLKKEAINSTLYSVIPVQKNLLITILSTSVLVPEAEPPVGWVGLCPARIYDSQRVSGSPERGL